MGKTLVDDRYELRHPVGGGAMADVFRAHDEILDRDVALKLLKALYAEDEEFVERFRREARSAASLSHPNIVPIFDQGESGDGTYYIAMGYLPGGTLKDRIMKRGVLQSAEALCAAHERGVIHRDVKPDNILIAGSGHVKVADFGIARAVDATTISHLGVPRTAQDTPQGAHEGADLEPPAPEEVKVLPAWGGSLTEQEAGTSRRLTPTSGPPSAANTTRPAGSRASSPTRYRVRPSTLYKSKR
jgi:serine/threonine protein kinase